MSIHRDKKRGRLLFEFDAYVGGRRVRARKLLPATWSKTQADAVDRKECARLYAVVHGLEGQDPLIEDAVARYLKERAPELKHGDNVAAELALMYFAYQGRPMSQLAEACKTYRENAVHTVKQPDGSIAPLKVKGKTVPLSPATIRNRLRYLCSACRYAWRHCGMGAHDPAEKVSMPEVNNARHRYIDRLAMLTIAKACTNRQARMAIRIAFYSGMRLSEIVKAIPTEEYWRLTDTKNREPRLVPIHPRVAVCARRFRACPRITIQTAWSRARDKTGHQGLHFHDLRHSAASEMINSDVDLHTVGVVLGHKDSRSTARYAHLAVGKLAAAVGKIGRRAA